MLFKSDAWRAFVKSPLLLPVYVPGLVFALSQGLLIPVLPVYVREFGIAYWIIGVVLAGDGLGSLLGDVPAGVVLRQLGQKRAMLLALVLIAVSTMALYWAPTVWMVFACRLVTGAALALFSVARHAYMSEVAAVAQRGRAMAVFGGVMRIGSFFAGPIIGGLVGDRFGLRTPFLLYSVIIGVVIVIIFLAVRAKSASRRSSVSEFNLRHLSHAVGSDVQVLSLAGLGQLFGQMIRAGRHVIIPLYAAAILGLSVEQIGWITGISGAVDMVLFPVAGWLMDRMGRKFAILPCFGIQGVAMAMIPLTGGFTSLLVVACLIGFGNGLGAGTMMTLGADLAPDEARGEFLGVWQLIGSMGRTGAPLVLGYVAQILTLPLAALAMATSGGLAVLVFGLFVPETLRKPELPGVLPQDAAAD